MTSSADVRALFAQYSEEIDEYLKQLFLSKESSIEMYGHLAYFMGFADEDLRPQDIYGGKRFRSSLCLLLVDWLGERSTGIEVATAVELFHNFTLIHDDIVDGDTLRRGRPTVWKLWGIPHAINSGDAQLLMVYEVLQKNDKLSADNKIAISQFLTKQYLKVAEGQYLDFVLTEAKLGDSVVSEETYYKMIECKTADLIAAAAKVAGMVAGVSEVEQEALFQYGLNLGIAYQICDDVVSIWGTSDNTGKRNYSDLLERKKTLPILYAYEKLSRKGKEKLLGYYNSGEELSLEDVREIVELLESVNVCEEMSRLINRYATLAKTSAENISLSESKCNTLRNIVDTLLHGVKKG